jgi:hypothetical protein
MATYSAALLNVGTLTANGASGALNATNATVTNVTATNVNASNMTLNNNLSLNNIAASGNLTLGGKVMGNGADQFLNFNEYKDTKIMKLVKAMADAMGFRQLTGYTTNFQSATSPLKQFVKIDPNASRYSVISENIDLLTYFTASFIMAAELINTIVSVPSFITVDPRQSELVLFSVAAFTVNAGDGTSAAPIQDRSIYANGFKFQYRNTLWGDLTPIMLTPTLAKSTFGLLNMEIEYDRGLHPISSVINFVTQREPTYNHTFLQQARDYRLYLIPQGKYYNIQDGNTLFVYATFWDMPNLMMRFSPMFYPATVASYVWPGTTPARDASGFPIDTNGNAAWYNNAKVKQFNGGIDYLDAYKANPTRPVWEYYHVDTSGSPNNLKTNGVFDAYKIEAWCSKVLARSYDDSGNLIPQYDASGNVYERINHCGAVVVRTNDEYYNTFGAESAGKQFTVTNISNPSTTYVNNIPTTLWSTGPMKGILVICLVKVVASVLPATLLAQLGATVIFVRDPEELRQDFFDVPLQNIGQVVDLNLRASAPTGTADRATFETLMSRAHVFITNLKESNFLKMGYTYAQLAGFAGNKGMVVCEFSAFGPGIYKDSKGFADNLAHMNGLADLMQRYFAPPSKYPFTFYQDLIGGTTYFNAVLEGIRKMKIYKGVWLVRSSLGQSGAFVAKNTVMNTPLEAIKLYDASGNKADADIQSYMKFKTEVIPNCGLDIKQFNIDNSKVFRNWTVKNYATPFNVVDSSYNVLNANVAFGRFQAVTTPAIHTSAITTVAELNATNSYVPYIGGPTLNMSVIETLNGSQLAMPRDGMIYKHNTIDSSGALYLSANLL